MKATDCYTGHRAVWKQIGKRYGTLVEIVAVNHATESVQVREINTCKTRFVPARELTPMRPPRTRPIEPIGKIN